MAPMIKRLSVIKKGKSKNPRISSRYLCGHVFRACSVVGGMYKGAALPQLSLHLYQRNQTKLRPPLVLDKVRFLWLSNQVWSRGTGGCALSALLEVVLALVLNLPYRRILVMLNSATLRLQTKERTFLIPLFDLI